MVTIWHAPLRDRYVPGQNLVYEWRRPADQQYGTTASNHMMRTAHVEPASHSRATSAKHERIEAGIVWHRKATQCEP
jgi:hypothetical protein